MTRSIQLYYAVSVASGIVQALVFLGLVAATLPAMSASTFWTNVQLPLLIGFLQAFGGASPAFTAGCLVLSSLYLAAAWRFRPRLDPDGHVRLSSTYVVTVVQFVVTAGLCWLVLSLSLPVYQYLAPIR